MTQCGQCLDLYHQEKNIPRICQHCGNSLCERCLNQIYNQARVYTCPYCQTTTKSVWAKNQSLISLINSCHHNKCEPHNRKAISLCCSANCIVSPAICDLAQCSKLHKQKGLNNLPLSFFAETPTNQRDSKAELIIQKLLAKTRLVIDSIIKQSKCKLLSKCQSQQSKCSPQNQNQQFMNKIRNNNYSGISSKHLSDIKKEMLEKEEDQQTQMMSYFIEFIDEQKKNLTNSIICAIDKIEINLFQIIVLGKTNQVCLDKIQLVDTKSAPMLMGKTNGERQTLTSIVREIETKTAKSNKTIEQIDQKIKKLCQDPKAHLEYGLIREVIGRDFNIKLLFSASTQSPTVFKQRIGGKPNLFIRIQLSDDKIIGSYFKQDYPTNFQKDEFVTDPDAFVFWLDQFTVYKAAKNSIAQYDISPDYLFSCGSTYTWDGFWFRKDFLDINPEMPVGTSQLKSKQYVDLNIPLSNRKVKRFEAYQLQFK